MKSFLKILLLSFVVALPSSANAGLYDDLQQPDRCHSFIGHALDQSLASHAAYVGGGAYDYTLVGDSGDPYGDYNTAITTGWNDLRTPPDYSTIIDFWFGMGTFYVDGNGDGVCWDYHEVIPTALERLDRDIDPRVATIESDVSVLDSEKVDKVSGKGLSQEDFTTTLKGKLDGVASGATANASNSDLRDRSTHTGTQAISTVSGLQSALDSKPTAKLVTFTGTSDGSGLSTHSLSGFTAPKCFASVVASAGSEAVYATISTCSTSSVVAKVYRNKTTGVLIGGTIDPDEVVTSGVTVNILVVE